MAMSSKGFYDRQEQIADFSRDFYHMCTHKTVQWIRQIWSTAEPS